MYFIKENSDVAEMFKVFSADVRADGHNIKRVRTDCGLEFCNKDITQICRDNLIKHKLSTPRAPEQNGFIERQNRTVVTDGSWLNG